MNQPTYFVEVRFRDFMWIENMIIYWIHNQNIKLTQPNLSHFCITFVGVRFQWRHIFLSHKREGGRKKEMGASPISFEEIFSPLPFFGKEIYDVTGIVLLQKWERLGCVIKLNIHVIFFNLHEFNTISTLNFSKLATWLFFLSFLVFKLICQNN